MYVSPKKDCPHILNNKFLDLEEFKKLSFKNLKCECCSEEKELWICITCGKAFCGRYVNNHYFTEHFSHDKSHCICISILDLSVWCYQCMTEGFIDPGSYIESDISSNYVKIYSEFKFGGDSNSNSINQNDINSALGISNEKATQIKYNNFIELLKKNTFKNISFLVGPGINIDKETKKNILEIIFEKAKKNNKILEKINFDDLFSKELFLSNPEILYSFLKELKINEKEYCKPNINHYFMKYLTEKAFNSFIFTENFECNEIRARISPKQIVFGKGHQYEGHCAKCNQNIDKNLIYKGIMNDTIIKCDKCGGPCKPKILLRGEEIDSNFYDQVNNAVNSKLIFIIGTDLLTMPFKDISEIIKMKEPWIVVINPKEIGNFKFYDITSKELFLEGNCEDVIKKMINDCGWNEQDIKNNSGNKSKYCSLEDFENYVLKEDKSNKNYFILSPDFNYINNSSKLLNHLSIFDIEERGTIRQDKETVTKILSILKNSKLTSKEKGEQLKLLNLNDFKKKKHWKYNGNGNRGCNGK